MEQWVPFRDGEYLVEKAFLLGENDRAATVEQAVMEVYTDPGGMRQIKGYGMVRNTQVVELLEEADRLDLILDLGHDYRYRLIARTLRPARFLTRGQIVAPICPVVPMD